MSPRAETWLWIAQRASAGVLAVAVVVHIGTVIAAVQGGLTAAEIGARLQGHAGWLAFYLVFVAAAAVHAPLGVRTVLREWARMGPAAAGAISALLAVALLTLGTRAALAVYLGAH